MHGNEIYDEISEQIEQGKGCIIFDFGLFSQFRLTDATMIFKFRLGEEQLPDMKLNHRYSNKCYYTITRKYGRRLSKCGYPYFFDLDENEPFLALLCITFGYELNEKKETADMVFPLSVQLTKDRPACTLMMKLDFDEGKIEFISHIREKNDWIPHFWSNDAISEKRMQDAGYQDRFTFLESPRQIDESNPRSPLIFSTLIEPFAEKATELYLY